MNAHRHAIALLFALLVGCGEHCGDDELPLDAGDVDAEQPTDATPDACICEPHWPGCPPGCIDPFAVDAGADGAP